MKHARFGAPDIIEQRCLGMAECGWRGLSEGWLLRHLGDVHWRLIAGAMGHQVAVFTDATGAPVYAAFCAVSEEIYRPALARPGVILTVASRLRRLSATRLISVHDLTVDGDGFAKVILISAFVRHGSMAGNAHIIRAHPSGQMTVSPMQDGEDGGVAAEAALLYRGLPHRPGIGAQVTDVTPCPTTDFNAAGLLYCANYPALVDRAEWALFPPLAQGFLVQRNVVYLGNVDSGDPVSATLIVERTHRHYVELASRGRVIARIVTKKRT